MRTRCLQLLIAVLALVPALVVSFLFFAPQAFAAGPPVSPGDFDALVSNDLPALSPAPIPSVSTWGALTLLLALAALLIYFTLRRTKGFARIGLLVLIASLSGLAVAWAHTLTTVAGRPITHFERPRPGERDFSDPEKTIAAQTIAALHPNAIKVLDATIAYNAHGKSFDHRRSWINNSQAQQIPSDDYTPVTGPAMIGDLVVYRSSDALRHTGIVMLVDGNNAITEVQSKWGSAGEYVHTLTDVPSIYGSPLLFRRTTEALPCEEASVTDDDIQAALVIALNGLSDPWGKDFHTVLLRSEADLGCMLTGPPEGATSADTIASASSTAATTLETDCQPGCSPTADCDSTRTCSESTPCPSDTECIEGHCYNPCCYYCGPGSVPCRTENPRDILTSARVNPCLNRACFHHDVCYKRDCVDAQDCYFTPQADAGSNEGLCDARLIRACSTDCAPLPEKSPTKFICEFVDCMKTFECTGRANFFQYRRVTAPDKCLDPPCSGNGEECPASGGDCVPTACSFYVEPLSQWFEAVVGTCVDRSFTINNGCAALTGTASTLVGPALPFTIVSGASFNLDPGASHDIVVRFCPLVEGPANSPVMLTTNLENLELSAWGSGRLCNNNYVREGVEQCDGFDKAACVGDCLSDCTCDASGLKPDLIVSVAPTLNSGTLNEGFFATFKGTIKNVGPVSSGGPFNARFYIDFNHDGSLDVELSPDPVVTNIPAGGSQQVISGTWTAIRGKHRVILCADEPWNVINESNETSNCSTVPGTLGTGIITVGQFGQF